MQEHIQKTTALLEIDMEKETIVRASFMTVLPHTGEFLSAISAGYNLSQGIRPLLQELEERAHIASIRAITKAVEIAYQKYLDHKKAVI